ncbi:MAG TPA: TetR/AcrR family transcriptional regulator [Chthoniobacterales bacterium]
MINHAGTMAEPKASKLDEATPALEPDLTAGTCTRKRKGEGCQRRQEILEAAKRLFAEEGYEKTTIRRIAASLGISSTALYVYFPDKNAVLAEICASTFRELRQHCADLRGAIPSDPLRVLHDAVTHYIQFGLEHPHEYHLTFNMPLPPEVKDNAEHPGDCAFQSFQALVQDVVEARQLHGADGNALTQQLWAGMHGLVSLVLLRPDFPWVERSVLVKGHVQLLVEGVLRAADGRQCGGLG